MQIWKWALRPTDTQFIRMPKDTRILCLQMQDNKPYLWGLVHEKAPTEMRGFATYGTGHQMPESVHYGQYVGTYQLHGGTLVFHVFAL